MQGRAGEGQTQGGSVHAAHGPASQGWALYPVEENGTGTQAKKSSKDSLPPATSTSRAHRRQEPVEGLLRGRAARGFAPALCQALPAPQEAGQGSHDYGVGGMHSCPLLWTSWAGCPWWLRLGPGAAQGQSIQ